MSPACATYHKDRSRFTRRMVVLVLAPVSLAAHRSVGREPILPDIADPVGLTVLYCNYVIHCNAC